MDFSIKFHIVYSGWSIVYMEGSQVITSKHVVFLSLKIDLISAKMQNYPFSGFQVMAKLKKQQQHILFFWF